MKRALVYTDLQATEGHEKCRHDPTKSLQIWRVNRFYDQLHKIYNDYDCDCLWDLGDTMDDRTAVPVPAINSVCGNLERFPVNEWNLKLIGNHEQYLRNTKVNIGRMFSPFFSVCEQNTLYQTDDGVYILACPYPAEEGDTMKWINSIRSRVAGHPCILIGHFQLAGCFGPGGELPTGVLPEDVQFVNIGLLGHIHKPQQLGKLYYVGSPFQQNWGEASEDKRVGVVDILNQTVEWVPILGFPRYMEVSLEDFKELATADTEDRFRVVLKSQAQAAEFFAHPMAHTAASVYDFNVSSCNTDTDTEIEGDSWTPENVMRRYTDQNKPADRGIDISPDEMLGIGLQILSS
jgi:hypothetical protein